MENIFQFMKIFLISKTHITFVEIGILDGGIEIWKKYFGKIQELRH